MAWRVNTRKTKQIRSKLSAEIVAFTLILFTTALFSDAENNFTPLTEPEIAHLYDELKADFEENPIFKNANINQFRDGVRSEWSGYMEKVYKLDANGNETETVIGQKFVPTNNAQPFKPEMMQWVREYKMIAYRPFLLAMQGRNRILAAGKKARTDLLIVNDFSESDHFRRFFTFDLKSKRVLFNYWTSHGNGSDKDHDGYAESFSNQAETNQSSAGFAITGETYEGQWGYSLRLDGIDGDLNSKLRPRGIVMHGWGMSPANYIIPSTASAQRTSYHGVRSMGCVMLSSSESGRFFGLADKPYYQLVIDEVKNGTIMYTHTEVYDMEKTSKWLRPGDAAAAPKEE